MPDVAIQQSNLSDFNRLPTRLNPVYLISIEDGKKELNFIATKLDLYGDVAAKCVGFFATPTLETIVSSYEEMIRATDISNFVEMIFPWTRIKSVRSLTYKHKTGEKK